MEENRSNKQVVIYTTYYKENQKLEAIAKQEEIVDVDGSYLYLKQQKIISNGASIAPELSTISYKQLGNLMLKTTKTIVVNPSYCDARFVY